MHGYLNLRQINRAKVEIHYKLCVFLQQNVIIHQQKRFIMKKFYLFIAAIAALTISTAQAQSNGTITVGDWENPTTYNGSYFDMAPTNFYLAHTGVQMIYTPDLLADMDGKENVKINSFKFAFHNESFEDIVRNVKIYLQEIEDTEFAQIEGVKQFFTFDTPVKEEQLSISLLDNYGEDMELNFELSQPFAFTPGKSLLVTMVFDAEDDDNCTMGSDYAPFFTSEIVGKAMTYTSNTISFVEYAQGEDFPDAKAVLGCGTNVALPLTEIGYTYEEGQPIVEEGVFLVGTFNGWNQEADGGRIEFVDNKASVELETEAEFKIITRNENNDWIWLGGIDENQAGYFLINNDVLGNPIELVDGANFRVESAGTYDLELVYLRSAALPHSLIVTKEAPQAITTISSDNVDSNWYNIAGQKFSSKPSVPGIYINNGKKIIVK